MSNYFEEYFGPIFLESFDTESVTTADANKALRHEKLKCPVCLTGFEGLITFAISCGHVLCKNCIEGLENRKITACPVCKHRFRRAKRIYL